MCLKAGVTTVLKRSHVVPIPVVTGSHDSPHEMTLTSMFVSVAMIYGSWS